MNFDIIKRLCRIVFVVLFLVVTTFLWQDRNIDYVNAKSFLAGSKFLELIEISDGINLDNAYPISDSLGMQNKGYVFKIVNHSDADSSYELKLINQISDKSKQLNYSNVRYQLIKNNKIIVKSATLRDDGILLLDKVLANSNNTYEIKFWISINAGNEILGKCFSTKIALY